MYFLPTPYKQFACDFDTAEDLPEKWIVTLKHAVRPPRRVCGRHGQDIEGDEDIVEGPIRHVWFKHPVLLLVEADRLVVVVEGYVAFVMLLKEYIGPNLL